MQKLISTPGWTFVQRSLEIRPPYGGNASNARWTVQEDRCMSYLDLINDLS